MKVFISILLFFFNFVFMFSCEPVKQEETNNEAEGSKFKPNEKLIKSHLLKIKNGELDWSLYNFNENLNQCSTGLTITKNNDKVFNFELEIFIHDELGIVEIGGYALSEQSEIQMDELLENKGFEANSIRNLYFYGLSLFLVKSKDAVNIFEKDNHLLYSTFYPLASGLDHDDSLRGTPQTLSSYNSEITESKQAESEGKENKLQLDIKLEIFQICDR